MLTLYFLLAVVTALAIYWQRKKPALSRPEAPGPLALPVLGCSYLMGGTNPFVKFTELAQKYGDVYSLPMGATKCVVISGVKQIRSVLMQNGKFFGGRPDYIRYHKLFAGDRQNSLALCDWCNLQIRRRNIARRHCDPKSHSIVNKAISDVGSLEMKEMVSTLRSESYKAERSGHDIEIKPIIMSTCLNLFTQYMCSIRFDLNDPDFKNIVQNFDEIFWEINQGYAVDVFPWLLPFYKAHMKKLTDWSQEIRNFILARIINMREVNLDDDEVELDFTDALLKSLKKEELFTKDAILFTLEDFLGGSSAVGNVVMLLLAMCIKNPDVAAKIQEEIDTVTGKQRPVTVADSPSMPYLMASIKETLRYSSSPIVPHVATEDTEIEGYGVEKGTVVMINNYKINMDEELWEEPDKFNPERFLDRVFVEVKNERRGSDQDSGVESENESSDKSTEAITTEINSEPKLIKKEIVSLKTNLTHFMPFSIGKRTCLGKGLVVNYGMVAIASILQNFNVSCKRPELVKTYTACIALPPSTFGVTLTPREH